MTSEQKNEIISLSSEILRRYFCECDVEFLVSKFAPDIVWLGAGDKQQAEGAEAVAACFRGGQGDLTPCRMWGEQYVVRQLAPGCWLCEGSSWIEAKEEYGVVLKGHQRVTLIYQNTEDGLKLAHIHNSLPYEPIMDGELFPISKSKEAYEQLEGLLSDKTRQIDLMTSLVPGDMVICHCDEEFSHKWVSEGFCRMLGYESEQEYYQLGGGTPRGVMFAKDYEKATKHVYECLAHGDSYVIEYRLKKKDGSLIWIADLGKRAVDHDGECVLYCFLSDITSRKEQESRIEIADQEIRHQANFLSQLYETVPCGIIQFSTDENISVVNANRRTWELYGYNKEEFLAVKKNIFDLAMEEDWIMIRKTVDELRLNGQSSYYERRSLRKDGTSFWISVEMERLYNADGVEVIQAVFNDITENMTLRREREQEQGMENRSLRAAICLAYPLIMALNLTQNSYQCFDGWTYISNLKSSGSLDQLVFQANRRNYPSYRDDFLEVFSREKVLTRFASGETETYRELQQMGDDGEYHWISLHLIRVENPYSEDVMAIALFKLLDNQRAEAARQEQILRDALASAQAANSAKSDFLSRMSHDIRTPMNAIIGMSAIGQLKSDSPARVRDCFRKIDASSRYLLSLINDILDMSKIEQGKMTVSRKKFDFTEFIQEMSSMIYPQAASKSINLVLHPEEPLEQYYLGDSLHLNQILMNLLSNSLKFTPEGGEISLSVHEIRRANGRAFLEFIVGDSGCGMSPDFMEKMFLPFEQELPDAARNKIGSGLGLAIVYNLVQLMGGTISVRSNRGKGTEITTVIPLELLCADEKEELRRKSQELMRGIRVLVVDDDAHVGEQTSVILSNIGAESIWVDSGARAVDQVRLSLEQKSPFDIAMIDWLMPDMDGLETTRRIRSLVGPDTMIIIISAYDWTDIEDEARAAGANSFITKPLFQSTVYSALLNLELSENSSPSPEITKFSFQGERVLLVEDNELNLEIAKALLEFQGLTVDEAEHGAIALEKFQSSPENSYLAILMDIRMPVMDGLEATRRIRAMKRGDSKAVPIIAMTANAFDDDRAQAMEAGMTSYLVKPIDIDKLCAELKALEKAASTKK